MIKNLILDFGKVLVDYDFVAFFRNYIPDTERFETFVRIINNAEIQDAMDRELDPLPVFFQKLIAKHPDYEKEIRYFDEHYHEIVTTEMLGMREVLQRFKAEGYKLYGLSNWCGKVYKTMEQFAIFRLLDGYVISSEEHVIKPEPEIYERLFRKFRLDPRECVFADDKPVNIEAGERLGMRGIVFTTAEKYEAELRAMLA